MTRKNRRFSPADKVRILKRHLVGREAISAVCSAEGIAPTQFYSWQKTFFENGASAFTKEDQRQQQRQDVQAAKLEAALKRKDSVIAQITEEHCLLKKELGEI